MEGNFNQHRFDLYPVSNLGSALPRPRMRPRPHRTRPSPDRRGSIVDCTHGLPMARPARRLPQVEFGLQLVSQVGKSEYFL